VKIYTFTKADITQPLIFLPAIWIGKAKWT